MTVIPSTTEEESTAYDPVHSSGVIAVPQNMLARFGILGQLPAEESTAPETAEGEGTTAIPSASQPEFNATSVLLRIPDDRSSADSTGTAETGSGIKTGTGMLLCYTSTVSSVHGYDSSLDIDLENAVGMLKSDPSTGRLCGIFTLMYPSASASLKSVIREYEKALIIELSDAGFDDILLFGFEQGNLTEANSFITELYSATGEKTAFGIALDFDFYESAGSEAKQLIKSLSENGIFFALDLASVEVPGLMTPYSLVNDRVSRLSSFLLTYGIRVVVGCGDSENYSGEVTAAIRGGALSVQIMGKTADLPVN